MKLFAQLSHAGQSRRLRRLALAVLPAYGLTGACLRLVNHGFNTTFRVDAPEKVQPDGASAYVPGRFLLRVHRATHHDPTLDRDRLIESELAWLAALRSDTAVIVPEPVQTAAGAFTAYAAEQGVWGPQAPSAVS